MSLRPLLCSRAFHLFLVCSILFPGSIFSAVVTLESLEIFTTHEWLKTKPTVYFQCKGENRTVLPDVKKANVDLSFKGEESWQPLTEFPNMKCKRCGFYEADVLKSDEFDEWEFCPSDFDSDGRYTHFKDKEVNATFLCPECVPNTSSSNSTSTGPQMGKNGMLVALVITISVVVSVFIIIGLVAAYKYWQKRKRQQEQARFLKLFEESDDIEDDLGLGPLSGII